MFLSFMLEVEMECFFIHFFEILIESHINAIMYGNVILLYDGW